VRVTPSTTWEEFVRHHSAMVAGLGR
jgi:hypothetical protein